MPYYTRWCINDQGSLWSGQAYEQDKVVSYFSPFSGDRSYEPTPPQGYYKISYPDHRYAYSEVVRKTQTVDTTEGELNNSLADSNVVRLGSIVSGNLSSENDVDSFVFNVPEPVILRVSFGLLPTSGIGTSSRFTTKLYHDRDGNGWITEDETYMENSLTQVDISSISLQDTGDFYLEVESGSFHTSGEYRFITELSSPAMTYSVTAEGRGMFHCGEGVTVTADVNVNADNYGLWIQNEGSGSINIFANSTITGGTGGEIPTASGIVALNSTPSTKSIEIYAEDTFGFFDGIAAQNFGSGDILIS